jgi:hypothetical protein
MKILTVILVLIFTGNIIPQIDTTRQKFFPLQIGNLWQYRNGNNKLVIQQIVGDTVIDGEKYFLFIHSLRTSGNGIIRIDSLLRIQVRWGGPIGGNECGGNTPYERSIYHLAEEDSTVWEICDSFDGILGYPLMRFNRISSLNIFGQQRDVMLFDFGGAYEGEDTIWHYGAMFAKGMGIIEERYFEGGYSILQGAIINGIQYGNIVSVEEIPKAIPKEITLYQNYPNPFNPTTKIRYEISKTTFVSLKIIDILGKEIRTLENSTKLPGSYETVFNASGLSSSVYIAVLQTTEAQQTRCVLLIK